MTYTTYRFKYIAASMLNSEINGFLDVDSFNGLSGAKKKAKNILIKQGIISKGQPVKFIILGKITQKF